MENNTKSKTTSIAIGLACVWMGTHFGPGVASGTQILQYWVKYGVWGSLCAILGYVNLPILILPAIFLAGRKISKKYLQEHNIEAPGIDE